MSETQESGVSQHAGAKIASLAIITGRCDPRAPTLPLWPIGLR